jgi:hypothetical protein
MITYFDLIEFPTFYERLEFLRTDQLPSELTFDQLRHLNQRFYNSSVWKKVRQHVIARDFGFDLAVPGREISGKVIVHHMNPLTPKDLYLGAKESLNPDLLITVSYRTHQAIHFGSKVEEPFIERKPGDTKLW